ncbi:outer membrane protein [Altererythrobacter sp. C41]|uniref:outer membrane protein n=1 Tax=Altererythrobacter sp. C41 TaxID=2806021 RepID=UPI0019327063|nr:outer membrane beta-barrel protein [Altererythrobacter sp. C41]MBM0170934.1 porin family protein [Altererythrobacter sp. C41]
MKKTIALIATGSLVALATPAMAQSTEDSPFHGPRAGVLVGYDQTGAGSSVDDDANEDNNDQSIEGVGYGVEVGYDLDTGGAVIGIEGEYMDSTADTEFENGDFEGFGLGNIEANRDLYVGLRAGVKATPNTLVYAKGGYTNAKFDVLSNDGTTEFSNDIDTDGYRIGGGVEYAMGNGVYLKGEYRYSNYSEAEIDMEDTLPDSERFDVDLDRHQVMASVGYRF